MAFPPPRKKASFIGGDWSSDFTTIYEDMKKYHDMQKMAQGSEDKLHPTRRIATRLAGRPDWRIPFEWIDSFEGKDKAFVFVVNKGEGIVIEDDLHLFPSDTLITQLRLLLEGK